MKEPHNAAPPYQKMVSYVAFGAALLLVDPILNIGLSIDEKTQGVNMPTVDILLNSKSPAGDFVRF